MRASIDKINKLLNSKKTITITTHTNPDGDAIGSSFALYHFLIKLNHEVKVITPNRHPDFLDWVPGINNLEIYDEYPDKCKKILFLSLNHTIKQNYYLLILETHLYLYICQL